MLFGLVPTEMEARVKFLKILQAKFEPASNIHGHNFKGLFSQHAKSL